MQSIKFQPLQVNISTENHISGMILMASLCQTLKRLGITPSEASLRMSINANQWDKQLMKELNKTST